MPKGVGVDSGRAAGFAVGINTGSNLFILGQGEGVAETLLEFGCAHGIRTERKSLPSKINGLPAEIVGLQALSLRQ